VSFDRYESTDVGHYLHEIFAHGWTMIKIHLSLALHKNEGLEGVNSEEKSQQQNHGMHGGCDTDMTNECCVFASRKLTRHARDGTGLVPHPHAIGSQLVSVTQWEDWAVAA
jgi:hypothetical protein